MARSLISTCAMASRPSQGRSTSSGATAYGDRRAILTRGVSSANDGAIPAECRSPVRQRVARIRVDGRISHRPPSLPVTVHQDAPHAPFSSLGMPELRSPSRQVKSNAFAASVARAAGPQDDLARARAALQEPVRVGGIRQLVVAGDRQMDPVLGSRRVRRRDGRAERSRRC
jgi:hypothetical protein